MQDSKAWADWGERVGFTVLQAGLGEAAVYGLDLPQWALVPIIGALVAIKAALAQKFGNGTSALLPTELERAG
jgi:hypothetical protein